jgi:hypothetical protein
MPHSTMVQESERAKDKQGTIGVASLNFIMPNGCQSESHTQPYTHISVFVHAWEKENKGGWIL